MFYTTTFSELTVQKYEHVFIIPGPPYIRNVEYMCVCREGGEEGMRFIVF